MVSVVQQRTVVVITVRRHERHLTQYGPQRFLKPPFPLPFGVIVGSGIHKITGENTETCVRLMFRHRLRTETRLVDILAVLDVAVGHIDERVRGVARLCRAEISGFAPVTIHAHTVTVVGSGLEIRSQRFVTHIAEGGVLI